MRNKPKRVAILVDDFYQVLEGWNPWSRLREEGFVVQLLGTGSKEAYGSKEVYLARVDLSIDEIKVKDFNAVIIPSGFVPDFLRRYEGINHFVRAMHEFGKVVASICHGGWVLVSTHVLKDKKITSFFAIKNDMIAAGART